MTAIWQKMDVSGETPSPEGAPASLPRNIRRLARDSLADLSFLMLSDPDFENVGYWPVTEVRPTPALGYRLAATFTREIDAEAQDVTVTYDTEPKALADRQADMIAAAKARYAEVADGGTTAAVSAEVTIPVATEATPVLKLTRALAYMTEEVLASMAVVTTAGDPVSLTPVIAQAMLSAVDAHVASCEATHNALVTAILDQDADHDSLDLIDIQAGTIDGAGGWTST